jgi:hypothetical protein
MKWIKVLQKGIFGFITGVVGFITTHPEQVTSLAGAENAAKVGVVVSIASSLTNYIKHRKD